MGGKCGLIGAAPMGTEASLDMQSILNGRTITGIVEGDAVSDILLPVLIDLYKQGRMPFDKMITYYPFEKINEAVADAEKGKTLKAVLKFQFTAIHRNKKSGHEKPGFFLPMKNAAIKVQDNWSHRNISVNGSRKNIYFSRSDAETLRTATKDITSQDRSKRAVLKPAQ